MNDQIPEGKLQRTVVGGKTAANVSGKILKYLAKKPFLSGEEREQAKQNLEKDYAAEIFKGLVMLKGTALKMAQMLSFELDIIPENIRQELEKSYNQVPPINRALVRKIIRNAFSEPPEEIFRHFDYNAFAAASLGQVHRAEDQQGKALAVKVQYPGIGKTIKSDLQMVRGLTSPTPYARFVLPVMEEIEKRLMEEIDYEQEARNIAFFHQHLRVEGLYVPDIHPDLSTRTVLSTDFLEGHSLDSWIETVPTQQERDRVAAILYEQFFFSLFQLRCLHADPNPGNFIVQPDGSVGLIDFGCVKRFTPEFIDLYKQTSRTMVDGDKEAYFRDMKTLNVLKATIPEKITDDIFELFSRMKQWYCQIYSSDAFDFGEHSDFILEGKKLMQETYQYRKYFQPNPEFVFLNRTLYGLFRIFEKTESQGNHSKPV